MQKTASKNIIPSGIEVMNFLNLAHNTITKRANFAISQNNFRDIFEKTMHGRGLKLCSYVPVMSFNKLVSGI